MTRPKSVESANSTTPACMVIVTQSRLAVNPARREQAVFRLLPAGGDFRDLRVLLIFRVRLDLRVLLVLQDLRILLVLRDLRVLPV